MIGKCGCNCISCPTYKDNVKTENAKELCSKGWNDYLGIKLSSEKIRACDGCSIPDKERKIYYLNCKVRKCTQINRIENCAFCTVFPCDELKTIHNLQGISGYNDFIKLRDMNITEQNFDYFVEPYLGIKHLQEIRQQLNTSDFKKYLSFSTKDNFVIFPTALSKLPQGKTYKRLYSILTSLYIADNVPYAKYLSIQHKRQQCLKILFVLGSMGKFDKKGILVIDANVFLSQKITGMYPVLLEYFKELGEKGINCKVIPLNETGWLTPMKGLKKKGWEIHTALNKRVNEQLLEALVNYTLKLKETFGNQAFKHFNTADFNITL